MAQTCSYTRLSLTPRQEAILKYAGVDFRAALLASCAGPASSIAAGMIIDVSADLQTECVGAYACSTSTTVTRFWYANVSTVGTPSTLKLVCMSEGGLVTTATDLSGEAFRMVFLGA